jgi:predicted hotdog family 3-hydroxylacyl-ACP dehydratase
VSRVLEVPGEGPWFEGHFPGRPILPGIAALALVVDALGGGPVRRIAHARFRQTIGPGERLDLATRPAAGGATRVTLARDGMPVLQADLVLGPPEAAQASMDPAGAPMAAPPLDRLLPHRAPMRFVDAVLAEYAAGADCAASVPHACAIVRDGIAPALAAIEACAQAAAVWEALRRGREGGAAGPRVGYLVALRDVSLHCAGFPAGTPFTVSVRLEAAALPLTHYRAEAARDGATILRGGFATVLA